MQSIIELHSLTLSISADRVLEEKGGLRLYGREVSVGLPGTPELFYRHGWQSWSFTAWTALSALPLQKPKILHPMQSDPEHVLARKPHGSGIGAIQFSDEVVLLLGCLGTDAHVSLDEDSLDGACELTEAEWFLAVGSREVVFTAYARELGERLGRAGSRPTPRVWCSWYSLYTVIDETVLGRIFSELDDLQFDVLQIDDGWQEKVGDWKANRKFPGGMPAIAERIRSTGRRAGLWLAPLIAVRSSNLFREHPDWFLRDSGGRLVSAGFNWGEPLFVLDSTLPAVRDWLTALMKQVRAWGFDYLKLDFLYAGALPGKRAVNQPREAAYRDCLQYVREAIGADGYLLACGAPITPSLGLCDALRIGPDVAAEWENERDARQLYNLAMPGAKNAIRTTVNRLWLSPLVQVDPDVVYFRSIECDLTADEKRLLQDLALICNFKATSDLPQWLSADERADLRNFLGTSPEITDLPGARFKIGDRLVDFEPLLTLPKPLVGLENMAGAIVGWAASQPFVLRIFDQIGRSSLRRLRKRL